ncbi:hypothetical protein Y1Q_0009092 [Alligator mississippiensis]|uniref:Endonuclease/exonuclease/phosphatase domain-containing protein n=1 Tax=Alligator mississippiensis TaxID=8496 RepID=A0A151M2E0_ALLMI|nr:hypothetical protein Y1Q_0009092 [Alligator mississippiensis]
MVLKLPLLGKKCTTIISAYTPTNSDEVKNQFYDDLHSVIIAVPKSNWLILLGNFNARIGSDFQAWDGIIGKHRIGTCNSNGLLLLRACAEHDLLVTNTVFCLPNQKKTLWMPLRSKYWHLINYIIVRRRDWCDVYVIKAMCGAECCADH